MKPGHVNAFARHFLNGLPTSFKQTIIVCEKLAPGEVVIRVSPDDYKHVNTLVNEDHMGSVSGNAKLMNFLKGATAVGVVTANGELLINAGSFIKSLANHGGSKTMDIAIEKMKFEACCNFKPQHDDKLNDIKESVIDLMSNLAKLEGGKMQANQPGKSGESDESGNGNGNGNANGNGIEETSWWSQVGKAVGSWLGW